MLNLVIQQQHLQKDKALLDLEYDGLVKQYSQFENLPTTKSGWKGFENSTKEYNSQLRSYKRALRPLAKRRSRNSWTKIC